MKFLVLSLACSLLFCAGAANAASFDCSKASQPTEIMICDSPELSAADDALGEMYALARDKTGNSAAFKKLARENLKKRGRCKTEKCLKKWYRESMDLYGMIAGVPADEPAAQKPAKSISPKAGQQSEKIEGDGAAQAPAPVKSGSKAGKKGHFVSGLKHFASYKMQDDPDNKGISMQYAGDGRNLTVSLFFNRTGMDALLRDSKGRKTHVFPEFPALYDANSGEDDGKGEYALGQHDFDGDGVNEIVVAGRTRSEGAGAISFCVYRVSDGKTWNFGASNIKGDAEARIDGASVLCDRHVRGLANIWQFRNDDFVHEELPMGEEGRQAALD